MNLFANGLDLILDFAQLFKIDLALDIGFNIVDVTLGAAQQGTNRAGCNREAFWSNHNECHNTNQNEFRKTDIKHDGCQTSYQTLCQTIVASATPCESIGEEKIDGPDPWITGPVLYEGVLSFTCTSIVGASVFWVV